MSARWDTNANFILFRVKVEALLSSLKRSYFIPKTYFEFHFQPTGMCYVACMCYLVLTYGGTTKPY